MRTRGDRLGLKEVLEDYEGKGLLAGILKQSHKSVSDSRVIELTVFRECENHVEFVA